MSETMYVPGTSFVDTGPRGCGVSRTVGGVYAELPLGPNGQPVEHFLLDPPIIIDPEELGLSAVGVKLIEDADGIWHVLDWVGSVYYPNVADMIEEVRHMGMSRRLPANRGALSVLGPQSKVLMVHNRGHIQNTVDYWQRFGDEFKDDIACKKDIEEHTDKSYLKMCVSLFWEDIQHGEEVGGEGIPEGWVRRQMPSFSYEGMERPENAGHYLPAIFAAFPIANLAVVKGDNGEHERPAELANESKLNVRIAND